MIYFIRHGQTNYNVENRVQGWQESVLTSEGVLQAQKAAEELSSIKFDVIYSSPLKRTLDTANIINQFQNAPIIVDDRIKERAAGTRENTLHHTHSKQSDAEFFSDPEKYGAETDEKLHERVISFFKEVEQKKGNSLIVSHGGVYKCIYRYLNGIKKLDSHLKTLNNCEYKKLKD